MTSISNSPASSEGARRRRGGRGRGTRPAGEQQVQNQRPAAAPAPVVVPVGADATVLPTDTTFEALGVPAPLVEVLTGSGINVYESDGLITDAVTDVFSGRSPRRALPIRDCATSCSGPGTGCG